MPPGKIASRRASVGVIGAAPRMTQATAERFASGREGYSRLRTRQL